MEYTKEAINKMDYSDMLAIWQKSAPSNPLFLNKKLRNYFFNVMKSKMI